jgi:hypothetical protein
VVSEGQLGGKVKHPKLPIAHVMEDVKLCVILLAAECALFWNGRGCNFGSDKLGMSPR